MNSLRTFTGIAVVMINTYAQAASTSLYPEGNGATTGNYAAGAAAEVADASTGWFNPAGLALLHKQQIATGGVGIFPQAKLSGSASFHSTLPGILSAFDTYVQNFKDLDNTKNAFVPSFHYAYPINEKLGFGLSIVSPFGLTTEWSVASPLRYGATASKIVVNDISPELGGKVTEHFALGAGLDLQYVYVKFSSMLGLPTLGSVFSAPRFFDSYSDNKGDSFGVGFHAGALLILNNNHSRIGLNYQSKVSHKFHGKSRLTGRFADPNLDLTNLQSILTANPNSSYLSRDLYSNTIEFPELITLSGYQDINEKLAVLGSIIYTGWHSLRYIALNNVAAFAPGIGQSKVTSLLPENYHNVWRFALGANYKFSDKWMLRVGGGYDKTPINNSDREVRVPDVNRWVLAIGGHYQWRANLGFDLGYTHIFPANNGPINKIQPIGDNTYIIQGNAKGKADLVGVQLVWTIDAAKEALTK